MQWTALSPNSDTRPNTQQSIQIAVKQALFSAEVRGEGDEYWLKFTQFKH